MPDTVIDPVRPDASRGAWRPRLFPASDPVARHDLAVLRSRHPHLHTHDTLTDQLRELFESREPAATLDTAGLERRVREHLDGKPLSEYGTWVWYEWSHRLVRILPEREFCEVRLCRNRNKITAEEQARLAALRIGIVGLSVGQATAVTLAMEGIGGEFVLADFDTLSLSNLNRLRAGVHDLGMNKAVLTARQLAELHPYLRVRLYPDGLHESGLEAFMTEGGRLDLVVEECDDMLIKWRVREVAREHRIPVLMETSDRGLLDVERFDLEPGRPIFHGRTAAYDSDRVRSMPPQARVELALAILGAESLSARLAASAVEIGSTLRAWPQLASAVSLGAAINTDAVRRIALGEFRSSGRYAVDLESLVRDDPPPAPAVPPAPESSFATVAGPVRVPDDDDTIRRIVAAAAAAPSGGNAQPWRFHWDGTRLRCLVDARRAGKLLDFAWRATWLAAGAAAENAVLAAQALGLRPTLVPLPDPTQAMAAFDLHLEPGGVSTAVDPLHEEIPRRCTNRRLGSGSPLSPKQVDHLHEAAGTRGAHLVLVQDADRKALLGRILGEGDRLRFLSRPLHAELMGELRWTPEDAIRTGDGIDLRTLELGAMDIAALRLTSSWRAMEMVGRVGGGRNLEKFGQRAAAGSAALGVLTMEGASPAAFLEGGRAMQRVWLTATALSLGFQPLAALPYLFMRAFEGGAGLEPQEAEALLTLRDRARAVVPVPDGHSELLWFRVAAVAPPSVRALRRPLSDILVCTP